MIKTLYRLLLVLMLMAVTSFQLPLQGQTVAMDDEETYEIVYFYEPRCLDCLVVEQAGIIENLREDGLKVTTYIVNPNYQHNVYLFTSYLSTYDTDADYPIIFAGDDYYSGSGTIIDAYEQGEIHESARTPLKEVRAPVNLEGLSGLITVIVAGLLDGINPCAIAMLLMFISILSFLKTKRVLLTVSIAYISGVLITYFLIGFGILRFLSTPFMQNLLGEVGTALYLGFGTLAFLFFAITFYDFLVTRKERYDKIKNQLPERLRNFNRRIMEKFTALIKNEERSKLKTFYIFLIPFLIGVIIGITEAACTGQIYFFILVGLHTVNPALGTFYLIVFNLLFILPLVVIATIAIVSKNVLGVSNFVRERLPLIKFLTAMFFLVMMVYFFLYAFGVTIPNPFRGVI